MAKQLIEKNKNFKVVGYLDKDINGNFFVSISDKDSSQCFNMNDILEQMVGTEISLVSVEELNIIGE